MLHCCSSFSKEDLVLTQNLLCFREALKQKKLLFYGIFPKLLDFGPRPPPLLEEYHKKKFRGLPLVT